MNGSFTGPSIKQPALGTAQMRSGLAVLDLLRKSLSFLLVGALWGCSNAVLKKVTSPDAEKAADSGGALGADGGRGQGGIWEGLRSLARAKVGHGRRPEHCILVPRCPGRLCVVCCTVAHLCSSCPVPALPVGWQAALAFAVNQSGSVLFYVLLSSHGRSLGRSCCATAQGLLRRRWDRARASFNFPLGCPLPDVSLAVPLCNSLTLVFTALTSHYVLGEELKEPRRVALGAALVLLGVTLCLAAK